MSTNDIIRSEKGDDGIVVLTIDDPNQSVNTMNQAFVESLSATIDELEAQRDDIAGVVVTSAKSTFFAGGDVKDLVRATPDDAVEVAEATRTIKSLLRRLETLGKPVVAAFNGSALGGGLEIGLACHRRIALDDPKAKFGTPEVSLGLLPGAGGVVRTVRMLGIMDAVLNVLGQGQQMKPAKALKVGIIDQVVETPEQLLAEAKAWIADNPEATQPWEAKGYKIPGGTPSHPGFAQMAPALPANLKKQMKGAHYDAPHHILCVAVESTQVDLDTAFEIETRYFVDLVCNSQQAKNMMQAFFFDLQHANGGGSRPEGHHEWQATKVAVLGAGMMGAGIAYSCARSGMEVVLKDVDQANAEKGKGYSEDLLAKQVERGRMDQAKADEILARIHPTTDAADTAGCDLVIEAVFESVDLKHRVFQEVEQHVSDDALLGSNTSSLPITQLAEGVQRQDDFIGLHFFSPVDKMPLVEVIRGERTSDAALARALDVVRQLKKTPIVVNDSRGFFTSRVIGTFLNEAVAMVAEGVNPVSIERAGQQAGYPAPPLQLMDELTLTLPRKLRDEAKAAVEAEGGVYTAHPGEAVIDRMVEEFDRGGKAAGAGFYDYEEGKRTHLWRGLWEHFATDAAEVPFEDLKERMMFAEALETVRCFDEGVIEEPADANIGSIFGIGFPAWTGGVVQYIDQYPGGTTGFVARAKELADRYGDHFVPPASLVERADRGEPFRAG
jgi:3-hydroxyacyl-CoA dehydrogenase / enoyl-CoA hydratase / 3-hydroxybutyryl-CoA epimerase